MRWPTAAAIQAVFVFLQIPIQSFSFSRLFCAYSLSPLEKIDWRDTMDRYRLPQATVEKLNEPLRTTCVRLQVGACFCMPGQQQSALERWLVILPSILQASIQQFELCTLYYIYCRAYCYNLQHNYSLISEIRAYNSITQF